MLVFINSNEKDDIYRDKLFFINAPYLGTFNWLIQMTIGK